MLRWIGQNWTDIVLLLGTASAVLVYGLLALVRVLFERFKG